MLEKARFADSTYGARLFLDEKVVVSRPSARLGASTEITKKNRHPTPCYGKFHAVWSFFWAAPFKKMREKARFADSTYGARLCRHEKSG